MEAKLLNAEVKDRYNFTNFCLTLMIFIILFRVLTNAFMIVQVDGNSMYNTLSHGDILVVSKYEKIDYGKIVVFDIQNRKLVKRVIAMGGDEVMCQNGRVYVKQEGEEQFVRVDEDYLLTTTDDFSPILVEKGKVFVLGDNRGISNDSRHFGAISLNSINGVVTETTIKHKEFYGKIFGWIYWFMRELYSKDYIQDIKHKRKIQSLIYIIVLAVAISIVVGIYLYFMTLPYGSKARTPLLIVLIVVIFLTITYSFLHFDILYGKLNRYYEYLTCNVCGLRETKKVTVLNVFYQKQTKEKLDFYTIQVLDWSSVQNDFVERTIYIDCEIKVDDIFEGDIVTIVTNSNYLLAYKKENVWKEVK